MCRHRTREQQLEGWRAFGELLPKFALPGVGVAATALVLAAILVA